MKKFQLGRVVITMLCQSQLDSLGADPIQYLMRHVSGDWGDLGRDDRQANEDALIHGNRILSRYKLSDFSIIYIITEADRSSTCLLLPEEY